MENTLKICNKCKVWKTLSEFHKNSCVKSGLRPECVPCGGTKNRRVKKPTVKAGFKFCIKCKKEKPLNSEYFHSNKRQVDGFAYACRECAGCTFRKKVLAAPGLKWCSKCKNEKPLIEFGKMARSRDGLKSVCIVCNRENSLDWANKNREKVLKRTSKWYQENKERYNKYIKDRRDNDINFRMQGNLRIRLRKAIQNDQKRGSAVRDLGCTIDELKVYLSIFFYDNPRTGENMNWNNYRHDGWHIDHIKPLSSFNLENREELLKAVHFTNLQPLWSFDNYQKSDK